MREAVERSRQNNAVHAEGGRSRGGLVPNSKPELVILFPPARGPGAVKKFHEAEDRNIYQNRPDAVTWRYHRFLLRSLIGRGEHLALQLLSLSTTDAEKAKQLEFVDSFLTDLRLTVERWHKVAPHSGRQIKLPRPAQCTGREGAGQGRTHNAPHASLSPEGADLCDIGLVRTAYTSLPAFVLRKVTSIRASRTSNATF